MGAWLCNLGSELVTIFPVGQDDNAELSHVSFDQLCVSWCSLP